MFRAITYNLANLLRFRGRQGRATFWPYVGLVVVLNFIAALVVIVPMMVRMIANMVEFVRSHPDQGQVITGNGSVQVTVSGWHPELMPDFSALAGMSLVSAGVTMALLAAAVARRLHDTGRSGAWGALPVPFLLTGLVMMSHVTQTMMASPDQFAMGPFFALFANNLVYLITLITLIVFLAGKGTHGENRYGSPAI